jgi:DNA mismatch endonuclease, patch repair protein
VPDVFTKSKRSEVMSRIRSRGNKATELALMRLFRMERITGWRRHLAIRCNSEHRRRELGGAAAGGKCLNFKTRPSAAQRRVRPDFVFAKRRVAVFVDGCFWHGCPQHATHPRGNAGFWKDKLGRNRWRDLEVNATLRRTGWRVLRIWEHELTRRNEARLLGRIRRSLGL